MSGWGRRVSLSNWDGGRRAFVNSEAFHWRFVLRHNKSNHFTQAMPSYRIHHLKAHLRQQFRFAPHVSGRAAVKPRDYEPGDLVESSSPYAAFFALRDSATPLEVGDVLEDPAGGLSIFKFVGFEEAAWVVPEAPKPAEIAVPEAVGPVPAA
jgi:hypothetical protein